LLTRKVEEQRRFFNRVNMPEELRPLVRAEQINSVNRLTPAMMAGNISNALVIAAASWNGPFWFAGIVWTALLVVVSAWVLHHHFRKRAGDRRHAVSARTIQRLVRSSLIFDLIWAGMPLLFLGQTTVSAGLLVIAIPAGMACIGSFSLALVPLAAAAFSGPLIISSLVTYYLSGQSNFGMVFMLAAALTMTLLSAVTVYYDQLLRRIIDQAAAEELAHKDFLTGLFNSKGFEDFVSSNALAPMKRHGTKFSILVLSFDNFGAINNSFGFAAGDELLVRIAERLMSITRPEDCVARVGGDSFAIACADTPDAHHASIIADRIVRNFVSPLVVSGRSIVCKPGIGIALAPSNGDELDGLLNSANQALFTAKQNKRGGYAFFDGAVGARVEKQKRLASALRAALERNELHLEYQPIYATRTKQLSGFETLLRWTHPEFGPVSPAEFIPIAEQLGLIQEIGEWIIDSACQALQQWPEYIRVSINFSPLQLSSPTLVDYTLDRLKFYGADPRRFEVEITESVAMQEDEAPLRALEEFRAHDIGIALDDFGTGYSSLTYICTLPVIRVKIDRSFVAGCFTTSQSLAVIQAIIGLANSLKLGVVAEGIETISQYHLLAGLGCEEIQGFLLSRPIPLQEATEMANQTGGLLRRVA